MSWQDRSGQPKYSLARTIDVSKDGIAVELAEPVEIRSFVQLQCENLKLTGPAAVRNCDRRYGKYRVGLEFTGGLKLTVQPAPAIQ